MLWRTSFVIYSDLTDGMPCLYSLVTYHLVHHNSHVLYMSGQERVYATRMRKYGRGMMRCRYNLKVGISTEYNGFL